jgi:virginiamycin B lyase
MRPSDWRGAASLRKVNDRTVKAGVTTMRTVAAFAFLLFPSADTRTAQPAATPVQIMEWTVPWEKTRPRDPYLDKQGRVWFVGQGGNYIAYLNPANGQFKRYEIEAGTNPHNLIVADDGMVWYSGNRNGRIGKLDPESGKVTTYMMPDKEVRDPHTLVFDKSGNIWFTAQNANYVGHVVTKTGEVHLIKSPTPDSRPYGIVVDPKNRPWFVEFGTNKIAMIDAATMKIVEHNLPDAKTHPRRIAVTSDGMLWYGDYTRGMLGRFDPNTGAVKEWPLPSAGMSLPYAMTSDDKDRIWLVETGVKPNRLVGFDPKTSSWFSITPISKSGGISVRHMVFHRPTRTIWFGTDANTIGRAIIP